MTNEERISLLEQQVDELAAKNVELIGYITTNTEHINTLYESNTSTSEMLANAFQMIEELFTKI